jgi:hypothetical protein
MSRLVRVPPNCRTVLPVQALSLAICAGSLCSSAMDFRPRLALAHMGHKAAKSVKRRLVTSDIEQSPWAGGPRHDTWATARPWARPPHDP